MMASRSEIDSLEGLLRKLPEEDQAEAFRILYGNMPEPMPIAEQAQALAEKHDFEVAAFRFASTPEQRRPARLVRVGVIDLHEALYALFCPSAVSVIPQLVILATVLDSGH